MKTHRKMKKKNHKQTNPGRRGGSTRDAFTQKFTATGTLLGFSFCDRVWDLVGLSFHSDRFGAARIDRQACALGV